MATNPLKAAINRKRAAKGSKVGAVKRPMSDGSKKTASTTFGIGGKGKQTNFKGAGRSAAYRSAANKVLRAQGSVLAAHRAGDAANTAAYSG